VLTDYAASDSPPPSQVKSAEPLCFLSGDAADRVLSSLPAVTYECAHDFTLTFVSSNMAELIGLKPEGLLGNRLLWQDRLGADDWLRLRDRMDRLRRGESGSLTHRVINDLGLPIRVAHAFRKSSSGPGEVFQGCLFPLSADFCPEGVESGVISQFVHKIGNHLQLMNLLIGTLKREMNTVREVQALEETVDRAADFARAFLHYTQVSRPVTAVDLGEILRAVAHSNAPLFSDQHVSFQSLVEESVKGAFITGDSLLLELALNAVLQNAREATKSGDRVIFRADPCAPGAGGASVRIAIADTGCGMEKEFVHRAMLPFTTSKRDRDGLGLSLAVRIVETHGGRLAIASEKNRGTEVEIILPLAGKTECAER